MTNTVYVNYYVIQEFDDGSYEIVNSGELVEEQEPFKTFEEANQERIYLQPDYDKVLKVLKETREVVRQ